MLEGEAYIKRFAIRVAERIIIAPLSSGKKPSRELFTILLNPKTAKGDRLEAGLLLVGSIVPKFEQHCANLLSSTSRLPVDGSRPQFIDYGGEQDVFLIETDGKKKVLKIDRQSLGLQGQDLLKRAKQKRDEYETILSCYSRVPHFIQEEEQLIVHSHLLSMPAVATVQPFIEGKIRDFFEDYRAAELKALLMDNAFIQRQFLLFAEALLERYGDQHECIDILGPKNLSVIEEDGHSPRLLLVDPHVIYTPELLAECPPDTAEHLEQRIEYIRHIYGEITLPVIE